ncbi:hypothetical protein JB92DRAFT_3144753 [Gautieria morchelliformis]|nr:hypothetical protein JB92DRAFT_3144753 [Gautieria morchelliformis]
MHTFQKEPPAERHARSGRYIIMLSLLVSVSPVFVSASSTSSLPSTSSPSTAASGLSLQNIPLDPPPACSSATSSHSRWPSTLTHLRIPRPASAARCPHLGNGRPPPLHLTPPASCDLPQLIRENARPAPAARPYPYPFIPQPNGVLAGCK